MKKEGKISQGNKRPVFFSFRLLFVWGYAVVDGGGGEWGTG